MWRRIEVAGLASLRMLTLCDDLKSPLGVVHSEIIGNIPQGQRMGCKPLTKAVEPSMAAYPASGWLFELAQLP
ncbi:hypothetical protein [Dyadobacter sp. 32]|uniref:hypothetical protein n=1 Tax=Dyadobacter sp. 32 TaxID=538966 RepID=UPI0011EE9CC0